MPEDIEQGQALLDSLVGRTVVRGRWFDESPNGGWAHHETAWLWFDDGRVIEFSSYGYDADGATVNEIEVMDIVSCGHCGEPHPDIEIIEHWGTGERVYFCDGNHAQKAPPTSKDERG